MFYATIHARTIIMFNRYFQNFFFLKQIQFDTIRDRISYYKFKSLTFRRQRNTASKSETLKTVPAALVCVPKVQCVVVLTTIFYQLSKADMIVEMYSPGLLFEGKFPNHSAL